MPPPLRLFMSLGGEEPGGPTDVGTQLAGVPAGVELSTGALELLGSNWEFGKACLLPAGWHACRSARPPSGLGL